MGRISRLFVTVMALLLASGGLSYALTSASTTSDDRADVPVVLTAGEEADEQETEEPEGDDEGKPEKSPSEKSQPEKSQKVKKARSTEGCPDGFEGNHGQFVSSSEDKQAAAHSDCGKPLPADDDEGSGKPEGAGKPDHAGKPEGAGKPDHAGKPVVVNDGD